MMKLFKEVGIFWCQCDMKNSHMRYVSRLKKKISVRWILIWDRYEMMMNVDRDTYSFRLLVYSRHRIVMYVEEIDSTIHFIWYEVSFNRIIMMYSDSIIVIVL